MTKHLIKYSLAIMTTLLALAIIWQFRIAVLYLLISVTLAATLRPLVTRLASRKLLVRAGWVLTYVVVLVGLGFSLYTMGRLAMNEFQHLAEAISTQNTWQLPTWLQGSLFQQVLVSRLLPPSELFKLAISGKQLPILPTILGITLSVVGIVSGVIIIFIMSLYWIVNKNHFERLWFSLLPSGMRKNAREVWQIIEPDLGAYVRSQILHSLMVLIFLVVGYWIIGSPYPILMSLAAAIACLIPFIGGVIAVILPLTVGLMAGVQYTLLMGFYTFGILLALAVWVKPRLYDHRWDNPILTLLILIAMTSAFGLVGIIIAPPLSAICQVLWSRLVNQRIAAGAVAGDIDFKQRQESVRAAIEAMDEPPPPIIISTMERLSRLIENAEPILHPEQPETAISSTSQPGEK